MKPEHLYLSLFILSPSIVSQVYQRTLSSHCCVCLEFNQLLSDAILLQVSVCFNDLWGILLTCQAFVSIIGLSGLFVVAGSLLFGCSITVSRSGQKFLHNDVLIPRWSSIQNHFKSHRTTFSRRRVPRCFWSQSSPSPLQRSF